MWILPEGDEVGVAEDGAEEGEQELPHLCGPLHVTPPDLGQQRLEEKRELDYFHQLQFICSTREWAMLYVYHYLLYYARVLSFAIMVIM